ncbi:MAG TPA: hypothetical protein VG245_10430 [Candidatus Dormibacteraeota bacterium]|jgi:hypothetical protein|nr:hypothetical protein [Candidatus Dormibacteraeota bacterium]
MEARDLSTQRHRRRLALRSETVRDLTSAHLSQAIGASASQSCPRECPGTTPAIQNFVNSLEGKCAPSNGQRFC